MMSQLESPENKRTRSVGHEIKAQIKQLVVAVLVIFALRSVFVEPFKIPSGSMIPTLHIGDFILVNKLAYELHFPFSDYFEKWTGKWVLIERAPPKRGDIVVFKYPKDPSEYFIKRVVGLPGDTIELKNKVIYINGNPVKLEEIKGEDKKTRLAQIDDQHAFAQEYKKMYWETLGEKRHLMMIDTDSYSTADYPAIEVPARHLFVMGDNRDSSNDSRAGDLFRSKISPGAPFLFGLICNLNCDALELF